MLNDFKTYCDVLQAFEDIISTARILNIDPAMVIHVGTITIAKTAFECAPSKENAIKVLHDFIEEAANADV